MEKIIKITSHVLLAIGLFLCLSAGFMFLGWTAGEMNGISHTDINQTESNFQLINQFYDIGIPCIILGILFDIKDIIRNFPNIHDND